MANTKYIIIYPFDVLNKVMEGRDVYVLDRRACEGVYVNDMSVAELAKFLNEKDKSGRFEFWYEVIEAEGTAEQ